MSILNGSSILSPGFSLLALGAPVPSEEVIQLEPCIPLVEEGGQN